MFIYRLHGLDFVERFKVCVFMELRKVQRTNSGTFFISLPKHWAERVGLDKGAVLGFSESMDGCLCLDPQYEIKGKPLSVVLKPSPILDREIVGRYLLGFDEIRVEGRNRISPEERALVKRTSDGLIGLEIVEEDYSSIVLQCWLELAASQPEKILRREYNIAAGMHRDAVRAFLERDKHLAKNVIARDVETNRFYFLLVRTLRTVIQNPTLGKKLGIRAIDCLDYRLCASLVEIIGDRSVEIAHKVLALKEIKLSKDVVKLMENFHSMAFKAQEKALKAFFGYNVLLAEEVKSERTKMERILHEIETTAKNQPAETVPLILTVASSIYRIFWHSIDIADLVMKKEL